MTWSSILQRTRLMLVAGIAPLALAAPAAAQTPSASVPEAAVNERIPLEVFKAPRPKKIENLACLASMAGTRAKQPQPDAECQGLLAMVNGREGWVELNFMVDTRGKPFEIAVTRSSGSKVLDHAVTSAIGNSVFEPGALNGKPIESDFGMKFIIRNAGSGAATGTGPKFVNAYKSLMDSIKSGDRAAADAALKDLETTNLYEDAYFGVATYAYAQKWGPEAEQLGGLRRAIADEGQARYLPSDLFRSLLVACFRLEINARQYGEAIATWKNLQKFGVDARIEAALKPIVDQVQKVRTDNSEYEVPGLMTDGSWNLRLFKQHFRAAIDEGHISQVKLKCDKRYVFFVFDPMLQYEVGPQDGNCFLELQGAPGTKFKLIQF